MRLQVLCFGRLRDLVAPQVAVELSFPATVADLWRILRAQHPALDAYEKSIAIAVNQSFASASTELSEGDEVALLPPVSGGLADEPELPLASTHARLQREPIDATALLAHIKQGEDGAVCLFDGIVRNHSRNRRTLYLEYDSYPAMALAGMEKLALDAMAVFPVRDLRIVHRVGRLEIGESSIIIVVASAHRAAAFDACRWIIDSLKQSVPVWKKEFFEDGAIWSDGEPFPPHLTL